MLSIQFRRFRATIIALWSASLISVGLVTTINSSDLWIAQGRNERNTAAFNSGAHWRFLIRPNADRGRCPSSEYSAFFSGKSGPFKGSYCAEHRSLHSSSGESSLSSSPINDLKDKIANLLGFGQTQIPPVTSFDLKPNDPNSLRGSVIRTAARPFQSSSGGSIPSSRSYTTRKPSLPMISVSDKGVFGDYNHYRTIALKSTPKRAISILTRDVSSYIQSLDNGFFTTGNGYRDGDLGENVLVEGVEFDFFRVGERYKFAPKSKDGVADATSSGANIDNSLFFAKQDSADSSSEEVILEITEAMEPCANLCKLQFINSPSLSNQERVGRCQYFIAALGQKEGLRGWYAKVVQGGLIRVGDSVSVLGISA